MKIAVTGKGGVGKTTFSSMSAAVLGASGRKVIALDADPDANLAAALGVPPDQQPAPLSEMRELIAERTGSDKAYGGYFTLNPKVDDIPEAYGKKIGHIHLLRLGGVEHGGAGCICPASALVKALMTHLVLGRDDAVIMDMEAGIEHLGRATAQSMDALVIVVNEGQWSIQTAHRIRALAGDLGTKRLLAVLNRVRESTDVDRVARALDGIPLIGGIPHDDRLESGIVRLTEGGDLVPTPCLADHLANVEAILDKVRGAV